jgi:transcriptional regulator with XRE-family HTH domain
MSNKKANAATIHSDKFQEFIADDKRRLLYERESLAFDAAEMIAHLMTGRKMNKAQLARAIGKSRAYVTQLLSGSRNMTIHTLADLGLALGYRFELKARECKADNTHTEAQVEVSRTSPIAIVTHHPARPRETSAIRPGE